MLPRASTASADKLGRTAAHDDDDDDVFYILLVMIRTGILAQNKQINAGGLTIVASLIP